MQLDLKTLALGLAFRERLSEGRAHDGEQAMREVLDLDFDFDEPRSGASVPVVARVRKTCDLAREFLNEELDEFGHQQERCSAARYPSSTVATRTDVMLPQVAGFR